MKTLRRTIVLSIVTAAAMSQLASQFKTPGQSSPMLYKDPSQPIERRVNDLVSRMTLEEKVSQMQNDAAAIDRLGIPAYEWWNEALHGVARAGIATVFPQAIGLAATWDQRLVHQMADAVSTEARAKNNEWVRLGDRGRYKGLTFWSPNINIFRDPRWGRGQETWGEDPFLTGTLATAFVKGLQGDDPKYLKVASTVKHYAVHSGPEPERHGFDAVISERDLRETYLPAFRMTILSGAAGLMCAYNSTDGEPACSNKMLSAILFNEWKFKGHVVSDCGAITDIYKGHGFRKTEAEAAAAAVKAGTDLSCGKEYNALTQSVREGLIQESDIDAAVKRLMTIRFRLGMFDPPAMVKYTRIPISENDSPAHRALARQAARESMVLLKNAGALLPLKKDLKTIAVIGPNADVAEVLAANYSGQPSSSVTPLAGIRNAVSRDTKIIFALGSSLSGGSSEDQLTEAVNAAKGSDVAVVVLGLSAGLEGEEMTVKTEGFLGGDRTDIVLPKGQEALLKAVRATGKPVVLVLLNGSALAINWANANVPAIVEAWYPGEEGGSALADVLFGDYNPAGRLPVTFYRSVDQLPPFDDYKMEGRTYRYFKGEPLYPFGYGLSYSKFEYGNMKVTPKVKAGGDVKVSVDVRNSGGRDGDEVVQLYLTDVAASAPVPIRTLVGISRLNLKAGEKRTVSFTIPARAMSLIDNNGKRIIEPGDYSLSAGGIQPGYTAPTTGSITGKFTVTGNVLEMTEK